MPTATVTAATAACRGRVCVKTHTAEPTPAWMGLRRRGGGTAWHAAAAAAAAVSYPSIAPSSGARNLRWQHRKQLLRGRPTAATTPWVVVFVIALVLALSNRAFYVVHGSGVVP